MENLEQHICVASLSQTVASLSQTVVMLYERLRDCDDRKLVQQRSLQQAAEEDELYDASCHNFYRSTWKRSIEVQEGFEQLFENSKYHIGLLIVCNWES